jgi:hypothetical protein
MITLTDIVSLTLLIVALLAFLLIEMYFGLRAWQRLAGLGAATALATFGGILLIASYYGREMMWVFAMFMGLAVLLFLVVYLIRIWMLGCMGDYIESRPPQCAPGKFGVHQRWVRQYGLRYLGRDPSPPSHEWNKASILAVTALFLLMTVGTVVGAVFGFTYSIVAAVACYMGLTGVYALVAPKIVMPAGLSKWNAYWAFVFTWGAILLFVNILTPHL